MRRSSTPPPYAELHAASAFSFLDGASLPEDLVERAAALGLPAMALVGAEVVLEDEPSLWQKRARFGPLGLVPDPKAADHGSNRAEDIQARLTLLAADQTG